MHFAASPRRDHREIPRAASYIEHSRTWQQWQPRHERLGNMLNAAGDLPKVAGFPVVGFCFVSVGTIVESVISITLSVVIIVHFHEPDYGSSSWRTPYAKLKNGALLRGSTI
jgi:hypothetical protein